jgi:hypothetical protein
MASARNAVWMPSANRHTARGLTNELADLIRGLKNLVDPYRPELYYMRGPGPKWHAKHDPAPAPAASHPVPALMRINA